MQKDLNMFQNNNCYKIVSISNLQKNCNRILNSRLLKITFLCTYLNACNDDRDAPDPDPSFVGPRLNFITKTRTIFINKTKFTKTTVATSIC